MEFDIDLWVRIGATVFLIMVLLDKNTWMFTKGFYVLITIFLWMTL